MRPCPPPFEPSPNTTAATHLGNRRRLRFPSTLALPRSLTGLLLLLLLRLLLLFLASAALDPDAEARALHARLCALLGPAGAGALLLAARPGAAALGLGARVRRFLPALLGRRRRRRRRHRGRFGLLGLGLADALAAGDQGLSVFPRLLLGLLQGGRCGGRG